MPDCIRAGLSVIDTALETFVKNPAELDSDRSRFDNPSPSYMSHQSHNSTRSQSPHGPSERQQHRDRRQWQLRKDHEASRPYRQFDAQVDEMEAHIIEGIETRKLTVPDGTNMHKLARDTVKKDWMEQGIWNEGWENMPQARWMHEESPGISSTSATDIDAAPKLNLFSPLMNADLSPSRPYGGQKLEHPVKRRDKQKLGGEASRPFHQFIYQVSKERERIQIGLPDGAASSASADINTRAYENVKCIWVKRGIWYNEWGTLPGMLWKHEQPIQASDDNFIPSQAKPSEDGDCNPENVSSIFNSCLPVEASHHSPMAGQVGRMMKKAVGHTERKSSRQKVSKTRKLESSSIRVEKEGSQNPTFGLDLHNQGTQNAVRRRSKRLQNQDLAHADFRSKIRRTNQISAATAGWFAKP